jgi:hypothetical protein
MMAKQTQEDNIKNINDVGKLKVALKDPKK